MSYIFTYTYTHTYIHKQTCTYAYIYIIFRVSLECFFLSDVEILALLSPCGTILLYNWDALGTKSVSLVHIELFTGTLKILNHRILMKDYCSTDKVYVKWRKETCPFCQKTYMQIYYPQLLCLNPRMLHVPLGVQVLVLTACGRWKLTIIIDWAKIVCEPWFSMELIAMWRSFRH